MAMYPGQAYFQHQQGPYQHQQHQQQQQQQPQQLHGYHNYPSTDTINITSSSSSLPPGLTHSYHPTRSDMEMDSTSQPHTASLTSPIGPEANGQLMTPTSGRSLLETEMPSLAYSECNSSSSKVMNQSPRMAPPSPSPSVSPQAEGGPVDSDYFLTSVLNMIAPVGIPPVPHYDYLSEFTQRQRIAKGGNGEIRRAYWHQRQCLVILKSLIDTKHTPAKIAKLFDKEVEVMNQCREHSNIVQFYGVAVRKCDDERNGDRFMIMHYYEHGDLVKLLEMPQHLPEAPTLTDRLFVALDIAQGLDHLYKCGYHHGDLHPKNVLIDIRRDRTAEQGRYQARLTDFGLRRIRDNTNAFSSQQFGGVWQFMAPERMAKNRPRYDVRCDIFALGVIYWQLMSGRYPFKDPSTFTPRAREARVEGTPNWYHNVYTKAWSEDPNERQQSLDEIVQVFRFNLGIPALSSYLDPVAHAQCPSPSFGYDTRVPYSPYDGGHQNYSIGSPYRSHSPMMTPSVVAPNYQPPVAALPPSPLLTNSSVGSTGHRSSNPNHPRNKQAAVPNGMPQSVHRT
ncbi:hypothetical protein BG006_008791 [Podila minutissima]|uniref:Protein kinase domain-containing protein n=1 Tax=Podila minutissima TaxID=64525 RepID=A0A9P5SFF9_9FUNG|nr:hypothetical protein BG006_008791 [Podila minutissima]